MRRANLHLGREPRRIDLLDSGRVDEVDALASRQVEVAFLVARVALEVLAGSELRGVDEQAHDDQVALGAGSPQQREVALVKEAHRRHQPRGRSRIAQVSEPERRSSLVRATLN